VAEAAATGFAPLRGKETSPGWYDVTVPLPGLGAQNCQIGSSGKGYYNCAQILETEDEGKRAYEQAIADVHACIPGLAQRSQFAPYDGIYLLQQGVSLTHATAPLASVNLALVKANDPDEPAPYYIIDWEFHPR
jgi:hypothetical protein